MDLLSIVVPCYNETDIINCFYKEISKISQYMIQDINFEFIFIDDGSTDSTLDKIKKLADNDVKVKYISFSRNFGKEAAIFAGLEMSKGDYIVTMDVDLQDPPSLIPKMYNYIIKDGYDCVATRRVTRKGEPAIRSFFARKFYSIINKISKTEIVDGARDFRLMTRQMANSIISMREYNRFSKGLFSWVGFNTKWIEYENIKRINGESKWSFGKLFLYSLDGITAFSTVPLAISSILGVLLCLISIIVILVVIIKTLIWGDPVDGYPSLICVITFIGGIQLLCIGVLGQYISKIYLETKKRPLYIIKEKNIQ